MMTALVRATKLIHEAQAALKDDNGKRVRIDTAMERLGAALSELAKEQNARHAREFADADEPAATS